MCPPPTGAGPTQGPSLRFLFCKTRKRRAQGPLGLCRCGGVAEPLCLPLSGERGPNGGRRREPPQDREGLGWIKGI